MFFLYSSIIIILNDPPTFPFRSPRPLSLLVIEQEASFLVGKRSTTELYPSLQSDLETAIIMNNQTSGSQSS